MPVLVSIAAVLVAVGVGAWWLAPGPSPSVLSSEDRAVLGGPDVDRGDPPPAVAYAVPDGAEAVTRAYLVAAYTAGPSDTGRTRLDAARYAEPGSPPAVVGVTVVDPPPAGARRVAAVEELSAAAADPDGTRQALLATVRTTTAAPGESAATRAAADPGRRAPPAGRPVARRRRDPGHPRHASTPGRRRLRTRSRT